MEIRLHVYSFDTVSLFDDETSRENVLLFQ